MPELRPYQVSLIGKARAALRSHRRVLLQAPTGSGKTVIIGNIFQSAAAKGSRGLFIVHRVELIEQTRRTFAEFGIPYGVIAAGYEPDPARAIQIASIDTLKARLKRGLATDYKLVAWDECHHIAAAGWKSVAARLPLAYHVGLTATPQRLDGAGLKHAFDAMVHGPSTAALIVQGFLAPFKAFAPTLPDLSGLKTRMGDYAHADTAMDRPSITGDAVATYQRLAAGKRALAFCASVEHSEHVAASFRAAGIPAIHVDGETPRDERLAAMEAFRAGDVHVLTSVDIFGEGVDVPAMEAAILLRPTKSLALHLQQCGRALRPQPGKTALILDHAGNCHRHGLPDDEREWTLEGRVKRPGATEAPVKQCPACFAVCRIAVLACPECGAEFPVKPREVAEVAGELTPFERRARGFEEYQATSLAELQAIGRARGYKPGWAYFRWRAREQRNRAAKQNPSGGVEDGIPPLSE